MTSGTFFFVDALLVQHGVADFDKCSVKRGTTNFMADCVVE